MKKKVFFTPDEMKRLNMLALKSPYKNTQWLIQKIRTLMMEVKKLNQEIDYLDYEEKKSK